LALNVRFATFQVGKVFLNKSEHSPHPKSLAFMPPETNKKKPIKNLANNQKG
jgi:hypothetical protein